MSKVERSRSRLGRGLGSLIASDLAALPVMRELSPDASGESSPSIKQIPIDEITPNAAQPRRQFDPDTLGDLAASIRSSGIIQPILVRPLESGFELIAGERRWRAARIAGLSAVPAIVRQIEAQAVAELALIENIQRDDLNPIDRAVAYRTLMDQHHFTQHDLAERLGEQRSGIGNHLRLLNLNESVRRHVQNGSLSLGHAKILAGIDDVLLQQTLADRVITEDLSVRALEQLLKDSVRPNTESQPTLPHASAHLRDMEQRLTTHMGMRVQVQSRGQSGKGRVTIHFGNLDQFDALLQQLGVAPAEI